MKTESKSPSRQEVEDALRFYVAFHLKPGDLEKVPELKNFITTTTSKNNG